MRQGSGIQEQNEKLASAKKQSPKGKTDKLLSDMARKRCCTNETPSARHNPKGDEALHQHTNKNLPPMHPGSRQSSKKG